MECIKFISWKDIGKMLVRSCQDFVEISARFSTWLFFQSWLTSNDPAFVIGTTAHFLIK
jgi:hypothetical protein